MKKAGEPARGSQETWNVEVKVITLGLWPCTCSFFFAAPVGCGGVRALWTPFLCRTAESSTRRCDLYRYTPSRCSMDCNLVIRDGVERERVTRFWHDCGETQKNSSSFGVHMPFFTQNMTYFAKGQRPKPVSSFTTPSLSVWDPCELHTSGYSQRIVFRAV